MHVIEMRLLSRKGYTPITQVERAQRFDSGVFSLTIDLWTHYLPQSEWSMDKKSGKAVRGSVEKSEYFMYFLLSAFCPEGGVVLDFLAGAGTSVAAARKAGVHLLAIDNDAECMDWLRQNRGLNAFLC